MEPVVVVHVYLVELVAAIVCVVLVILFGSRGQYLGASLAVSGALYGWPIVTALGIWMAWAHSPQRAKNGA